MTTDARHFKSKYSIKQWLPWPENPNCNIEILRERHKSTYAEQSKAIKSNILKAMQSLEATWGNNILPDYQQPKPGTKPVIDAMFCIGSGPLSWDRALHDGIFNEMRQIVVYECLREVLAQRYDILGPSYIQDPVFGELDKVFMAERGLVVTLTAERDMTSNSCLFATPMMPYIPSGMVADYQPQVYIGFFSPTRTEPESRDYKAHQIYMETHASAVVEDKTEYDQEYSLWIRKDNMQLAYSTRSKVWQHFAIIPLYMGISVFDFLHFSAIGLFATIYYFT